MKLSLGRNTIIFALSLAAGGAAAMAMHSYLRSRMADIEAQTQGTQWVKVLVPKSALAAGTVLSAENVAQRDVPAQWVHSGAIRADQFARAEHQALATAASAGEALLWTQLAAPPPASFAARLEQGQRAITVAVDEVNSVSGLIEPGDRIDLVAVLRLEGQTLMLTLLQDTPVLATGDRATQQEDSEGKRRSYTTITLQATPLQARQVLAAREVGKLAALLRAPGDVQRGSEPAQAAAQLLGLPTRSAAASAPAVQVLYGNDPALRDARRAPAALERP